MKKFTSFTIGSDPEFMVFDLSKKKIVSSLPLLPDKEHPIDLGEGILVYADNILAEAKFPPARTKAEFIGSFRNAFQRLERHLGNNFNIAPVTYHVYDEVELSDKKSWEIGCTPSYNGYTERENPIIKFKDGTRTGSAHIHIGNQKLCNFDVRHQAVRLLDIFLGVASVIFEKDGEPSRTRRRYYGSAGEYRPTSYGLEYRVLSPYVLRNPELIRLVYDLVDFTMSIIEGGDEIQSTLDLVDPKAIQYAINEADLPLARRIFSEVAGSVGMPVSLFRRVKPTYNVRDFHKNWQI
jgi:Phage phiEco32-like COOH.NH2 ligase-type 2